MHHHDALGDAVVFILLGTANLTLAFAFMSVRHRLSRLDWKLRPDDGDDRDVRVVQALTLLGVVSAVWGGTGLQDWVGLPLAVVVALGPSLLIRFVGRWLHNRRADVAAALG